jgi:uncharacterized protein YqeY
MTSQPAPSLHERLRAALPAAMKARDAAAVAAIRSALGAVGNAQATELAPTGPMTSTSVHMAGSAVGVGATEAERRELTENDIEQIVSAEVTERRAAAEDYAALDQEERAERLRAEADVLAAIIRG